MDKKLTNKPWITKRFEHTGMRRYYVASVQKNLFNQWEVFRCWGGINKATGSKIVMPCESYEDALNILTTIEKQRQQKKYQLRIPQ